MIRLGIIISSVLTFLFVTSALAQGSYMNTGSDTFLMPIRTRQFSTPAPSPVFTGVPSAPIAPVLMPTATSPNGSYYQGSPTYSRQVFPGQVFGGEVVPGRTYAGLTGVYMSKPLVKPGKAGKDAASKSKAMAFTDNVVDGYGNFANEGKTAFQGKFGMGDVPVVRHNRFDAHRNRWMIYDQDSSVFGGVTQ